MPRLLGRPPARLGPAWCGDCPSLVLERLPPLIQPGRRPCPPHRGALHIQILSPHVATGPQPCLHLPGLWAVSFHAVQGDKMPPCRLAQPSSSPSGQLLIFRVVTGSSLNFPSPSAGLYGGLIRTCFPKTSSPVPSKCDLKPPFGVSWVGLWFQTYF